MLKRLTAFALALLLCLPAWSADTKISALPSGTAPQSADQVVIARAGANFQLTWAQLLAGVDLSSYLTIASAASTYLTQSQAATDYLTKAGNLSGLADAPTSRTNLGLGTIATQAANNVSISGGAITGTTISGSTGSFTTLAASSTVSGAGFSTYLASPPAIGGSTPAAGTFTPLTIGAVGSQAILQGDAANTLAQRNGVNAQVMRVYSSFTDGSNYARLKIDTTASPALIATEALGSGSLQQLKIIAGGGGFINFANAGVSLGNNATTNWNVNSSGHFMGGVDNTYDIGAAGATRPRSIYTGTDVSAPKLRARGGTTPSMGACGTSPSVSGNDSGMLVTVGTGGSATSCAVTFSTTWTTAPVCVAQNDTDRVAYSIVTAATTVTITATAAFTASSKFHLICIGTA